ncbi:hypothetical protein [Hydrogenophaga sp. PAMC20947]|uniref:hypothetical protein n=1 Tax=Hydrogenophaga sp. PAMC20947 TaxID=2565558 RepID=UPI00109DECC6|nr:hypothetical protein [Hydrogenophaga sp. PAMC20947]QCB46285.1 hypothetical protein E5678_09785 [Hydrogenophaga sp. PAMC20947]
MKAIQTLAAACCLLLSGFANAAPSYNGTIKGTVDGKPIDVKAVCERSKLGTSDRLKAMSDPGMEADAKDRNGDGIAVSVSADMTQLGGAFNVLAGGRVYKFGTTKAIKLTPTGLALKANFKPSRDKPELTAYDVDLTVDCP